MIVNSVFTRLARVAMAFIVVKILIFSISFLFQSCSKDNTDSFQNVEQIQALESFENSLVEAVPNLQDIFTENGINPSFSFDYSYCINRELQTGFKRHCVLLLSVARCCLNHME